MVHGLQVTYGEQVDFTVANYQDPESVRVMKEQQLGGEHGMLIYDAAGKRIWMEEGHKQKEEIVKGELSKLLRG